MKKFFGGAAFVLACECAGAIGAFFTASAIPGWYATLARPHFAPPNWVFGPVWTFLYAMMGIAAFLVWQMGMRDARVRSALRMFALQLALNVLWSIIFFGMRSVSGALVDIALLWLAIVAMIVYVARVSRPAAWLLAPYILWVSFAAYLNASIWVLNK